MPPEDQREKLAQGLRARLPEADMPGGARQWTDGDGALGRRSARRPPSPTRQERAS